MICLIKIKEMTCWYYGGLLNKIKGEHIMKKVLVIFTACMIIFSSLAYAGGDKVRGAKGQGSTGSTGGGATTQTRGN
jgi:hypothetical protein